jgi:hypothetical protein
MHARLIIALGLVASGMMWGASGWAADAQGSEAAASPPPYGALVPDYEAAAPATGAAPSPQAKAYSPAYGRKPQTRVLWGDMHVHSANSPDAFAGGLRITPEETFRIARGEKFVSATGIPAQMSRPLDFIVLSDHSEALGLIAQVFEGNPALVSDPALKRWNRMLHAGGAESRLAMQEMITGQANNQLPSTITDPKIVGPLMKSVWQRYTAIADQYNEPGKFTTLIGYEWTPQPGGDNLHRVVVFREGQGKADQVLPFSSWMSEDPEKLWAWMGSYEQKTGGKILAIPHNANLSNGRMFEGTTFAGAPLTPEYARQRSRWEPIQEIVQVKGASESHPLIAPNDEFIDYGVAGWDLGNLSLTGPQLSKQMMATNYFREGLKRGLEHQGSLGVNPFKFGVIGASDVHNAFPSVDEANFFGKFPSQEPSPDRWKQSSNLGTNTKLQRYTWQDLAAGYAAVWATDNTREAIWDALTRKETYATSGTRMTVRFFGGYEFQRADAHAPNLAEVGYAKGVSMGGDLKPAPAGKAPTFLVAALKDPQGANLDRIQVVKGWVDADGKARDRIYDVVWSGDRKPGANGKLPPVGDTVDTATATWSNTIGAPELTAVWVDPDFVPGQRAFYYARVVEIPTPTWLAYDQVRFGIKVGKEVPLKQQERAWTSPIWYTPN